MEGEEGEVERLRAESRTMQLLLLDLFDAAGERVHADEQLAAADVHAAQLRRRVQSVCAAAIDNGRLRKAEQLTAGLHARLKRTSAYAEWLTHRINDCKQQLDSKRRRQRSVASETTAAASSIASPSRSLRSSNSLHEAAAAGGGVRARLDRAAALVGELDACLAGVVERSAGALLGDNVGQLRSACEQMTFRLQTWRDMLDAHDY